jgi:hypothetical protein
MKLLPITAPPPPPTAQIHGAAPITPSNNVLVNQMCTRIGWLVETQEWMGVWTCGWMLAGVVGGGMCGGRVARDGWRVTNVTEVGF